MGATREQYMDALKAEAREENNAREERLKRIRDMARRVMIERDPEIWFKHNEIQYFCKRHGMNDKDAREVQDLFFS